MRLRRVEIIKPEVLTESLIQTYLWLDLQTKMHHVTPNVSLYNWESDMIGITGANFSHEYEIKISKADFRSDRKKSKHRFLTLGTSCSNYFWYCCPSGIIPIEEVPDYAGLLYITPTKLNLRRRTSYSTTIRIPYIFEIIKPAPKLHNNKISDKGLNYLSRGLMLRYWSLRCKDLK